MDEQTESPLCDLIMKGGITSGVVYPRLVKRLSEVYRFKSIGGTSAGAIAAAGCAAAEYARQHGSNPQAFDALGKLPEHLGGELLGGGSRLFHLFQPAPALQRHFQVLGGMLNAANPWQAALQAARAMLRQFWRPAVCGAGAFLILLTPTFMAATGKHLGGALLHALILGALCGAWGWLTAQRLASGKQTGQTLCRALAALVALILLYPWLVLHTSFGAALGVALVTALVLPGCAVLAFGASALGFVRSLLCGMAENFFGLCSGHKAAAQEEPQALTDWLGDYFNQLAGLPADTPLTFGHLWGQPAQLDAIDLKNPDWPREKRQLNLEVMTTAVSQNMAFAIPFREGSGAFYYDPDEWARLFPKNVMDWLNQAADAVEQAKRAKDADRPDVVFDNHRLKALPPNHLLPVVVAVRMSLSFPLLLSAVPLYARDFSASGRPVKRVWFSDGGICSNLPLHMFDAPLPNHPTFAVNLTQEHPDHPIDPPPGSMQPSGRLYLPGNKGGRQRYWAEPRQGTAGLFELLWQMIDTMQSWRDEIQFPYPGFRDRIVQIAQKPDEGGLNLDMPKSHIDALGAAGEGAAELFIERFRDGNGWRDHQEVRLRSFLGQVEDVLHNPTMTDPHWELVAERCRQDGDYTLAETKLAKDMLGAFRLLQGHIRKAAPTSVSAKAPRPRAILRIFPRI